MIYRCPTHKRHEGDIIGCGVTFSGRPDDEGLIDCPNCGMWFERYTLRFRRALRRLYNPTGD